MLDFEKEVDVSISSSNLKHYRKKGYLIDKKISRSKKIMDYGKD